MHTEYTRRVVIILIFFLNSRSPHAFKTSRLSSPPSLFCIISCCLYLSEKSATSSSSRSTFAVSTFFKTKYYILQVLYDDAEMDRHYEFYTHRINPTSLIVIYVKYIILSLLRRELKELNLFLTLLIQIFLSLSLQI